MADKIKDGIFEGSGPFAIPLLAEITSLDNPGHPEFALLRCRFEDGATVYVPVANRAADHLIDLLGVHRLKRAEAESKNEPRH